MNVACSFFSLHGWSVTSPQSSGCTNGGFHLPIPGDPGRHFGPGHHSGQLPAPRQQEQESIPQHPGLYVQECLPEPSPQA